MAKQMTCYERLEAAWNLEEPDRVPVAPILCYIIPYLQDLSIHEMFFEPEKLIEATKASQDIIGDHIDPNITTLDHLSLFGRAGWDQVTLDWRLWEEFPPEGNLPSLYEKPILEDYQDLFERGFAPIMFNTGLLNGIHRRNLDEFLYYQFEYPAVYARAWRGYVEETGIPLLMGGRMCHPLDLLQYYRGINQLTMDLFETPDVVKRFLDGMVEYEAMRAMRQAEIMGAGEVPGAEVIFFVNGGPPGMSPRIFDEFYWPYAKRMIDLVVNRGFKVWNHWDNDLTPNLETMRAVADGLPKGRIVMDFEKTDMAKAKEILGDKVCLYGNVPSAMYVYGTPEEVDAYCKKLIEVCAPGGGYILGSECEVPWDAKPENIRAMLRAAEKYGRY
jgi:hypothetical protein